VSQPGQLVAVSKRAPAIFIDQVAKLASAAESSDVLATTIRLVNIDRLKPTALIRMPFRC